MSTMGYGYSRRYSPHSIPFPDYNQSGVNDCLSMTHALRLNPGGYPMGGPVGDSRMRPDFGHDEPLIEHGPSRRRIAVACGRCRKRKIRCSGDAGDGMGCTNCKAAGLPHSQCLFHRVGSDQVGKVIDNIMVAQNLTNLANSGQHHALYGAPPHYNRSTTSSQMDHPNPKSMYPASWIVPCCEETSPVDSCFPEHPGTYPHHPGAVLGSNTYTVPDQWSYPLRKTSNLTTMPYYGQVTPCMPDAYTSSNSASQEPDLYSSMNMTSLQMSLPERPPPRRNIAERSDQRNLLPIPQPSSHQSSRNVVDQLQHQRLRSAHAMGPSSMTTNTIYSKPLTPWVGDGQNPISTSCSQPSQGSMLSAATDVAMAYPSNTFPAEGTSTTSPAVPLDLKFSTSGLLSSITAPSPSMTYSNFRQSRTPCQSSIETSSADGSGFSMYTFDNGKASRNKYRRDGPEASTLVSGHRYSPPASDESESSFLTGKPKQEHVTDRKGPVHRSSLNKLTTKF